MKTPRLYHDLTDFWPLVNPPSDYAAEAERIRDILHRHWGAAGVDGRRSLLELGVGAGYTLGHLCDEFDATGVDVSAAMLEQSRVLNPMVSHHLADFRHVRLGRTYDAVLAHDALDYMLSEVDLRAAIVTAAEHLVGGGLFIAAANYTCDTFTEHELAHDFHCDEQTALTSISYVHTHPSGPGVELVVLLLIREDGGLRVEEDRHHCGLFPVATWRRLLDEAGFDVAEQEVCPAGTWFTAVKRGSGRQNRQCGVQGLGQNAASRFRQHGQGAGAGGGG